MQEEIEHKTVNFAISTTKLSARTLLRGMQFLLRQYDKHASQGKQSMKRLIQQNRGVTNLSTNFARFLLLQAVSSINISKEKFRFVPIQDFSKPWTDAELYAKYNLTDEEIAFIESMIKPMELGGDE